MTQRLAWLVVLSLSTFTACTCGPGTLPGGQAYVAVSAGWSNTCARVTDGTVYCWGANQVGQCGLGEKTPEELVPTRTVVNVSGAVDVGTGEGASCVVQGGGVFCWGSASKLGNGRSDTHSPQAVPTLGLDRGWKEIEMGQKGVCVLSEAGEVRCWDVESIGREGTSEAVQGLSGVVELAVGQSHACARNAEGKVLCFGGNSNHQLGAASTASSTTPLEVAGLPPASAIGVGDDTSCAIAGGAVYCWGQGSGGELGNGTTVGSVATPGQVTGLPGPAVQVEGGDNNICARLESGEVWCWGQNNLGQLGNGTTDASLTPVKVLLDAPAAQLTVGYTHACVVTTAGAVQCWGDNWRGKLGVGSEIPSARPLPVAPPGEFDAGN